MDCYRQVSTAHTHTEVWTVIDRCPLHTHTEVWTVIDRCPLHTHTEVWTVIDRCPLHTEVWTVIDRCPLHTHTEVWTVIDRCPLHTHTEVWTVIDRCPLHTEVWTVIDRCPLHTEVWTVIDRCPLHTQRCGWLWTGVHCLESGRPGFDSRFRRLVFFPQVESCALVFQWLPCQAPGVVGSVLGLVCPASVYCGLESKFDMQILSQCGSSYN